MSSIATTPTSVNPAAPPSPVLTTCPSCGSGEAFWYQDPTDTAPEIVCPNCIFGNEAPAACLIVPTLATYVEVLPARTSSPHSAIRFTPCDGALAIDTARVTVHYRVREFPVGFEGRGFRFEKLAAEGDDESQAYDVYCGKPHDMCECKGWLRWHTCKHLDAIHALIDNGWLPERTDEERSEWGKPFTPKGVRR